MNNKELIKLHLGCGGTYLPGYVNIDYPQAHHTTAKVKADRYADLKELAYPDGSVAEVRSHHVFEHFSRQWALKLLSRWHRWLVPGGTLVIETPDFDECVRRYKDADTEYRFKLLRHIFGSHEAHWAYHLDGWGENKFGFVLKKFGFENLEFKKILAYHSNVVIPKISGLIRRANSEFLKDATGDRLPNILVRAIKSDRRIHYSGAIKEVLALSMVGKETNMLRVWLKEIGIE